MVTSVAAVILTVNGVILVQLIIRVLTVFVRMGTIVHICWPNDLHVGRKIFSLNLCEYIPQFFLNTYWSYHVRIEIFTRAFSVLQTLY